MTMVPRMGTVSMVVRMASVATWSARSRSPVPMVCAEAIAASSTTRANSSASSNSIWWARFLASGCLSATRVAMCVPPEVERSKRADAGHILANDQRMNIVSAFVCFYRFQVHHVAHHRVIIGNAVCAQDVTRHASTLQRHPYIVSLGHGDVLVPNFICVLETAHLQGQKLSFGDLADHPGQLFLDKLMRCNWLVTELLAHLGILQRRVIAGHGRANRAPADAITSLIQAAQRGFQAVRAGKKVFQRDANILQGQS